MSLLVLLCVVVEGAQLPPGSPIRQCDWSDCPEMNVTQSDHRVSPFLSNAKRGDNVLGSVRPSVRLGLLRAHYTPLQRYMGYLCTRKAQYAPPRRNMHYGAQGRLCFFILGARLC